MEELAAKCATDSDWMNFDYYCKAFIQYHTSLSKILKTREQMRREKNKWGTVDILSDFLKNEETRMETARIKMSEYSFWITKNK